MIKDYDYTKTVFCVAGTGNIAVDCLQYLHETKGIPTERLLVICRKTETGVDGWQKSLRAYALNTGIQEVGLTAVYDLEDLVFLSLEFDRIIKPERFQTSFLYNIHFSALPEYKGMYTSILPILHNKKETGVTFHKIDAGIDTGDIIFQERFAIDEEDTAEDVFVNLVRHGTQLVKRAIDEMIDRSVLLQGKPQSCKNSTYYSKRALDYQNLIIDLNQTAECIRNQIRAYFFPVYQMPVIYNYKVRRADISDKKSEKSPGTVIEDTESYITIATIDYDLVVWKSVL
ncbi:MAG: hypothetical protein IJP92_14745 [Lachnospiraceae bacterium]|nr:hypothetical protein [Lachnospiraceae bacterium]